MEQAEEKHLLVVPDEAAPGRRRVLLDGQPVPGTPNQVLASLWEQGWVRVALWMRVEHGADGPREVLHEARLARPHTE